MRLTQTLKVLKNFIRISAEDPDKWIYGSELQEGIGYKAPTRFCELCGDYPEMIESRKEGRFLVARFRFNYTAEFLPLLPLNVRKVVENALQVNGVKYGRIKRVPFYNKNGTVSFKYIREER